MRLTWFVVVLLSLPILRANAEGPAKADVSQSPDDFYKAYIEPGGSLRAQGALVATANAGTVDVAAEAIQILGQIVVDRASTKAYGLIKARLEKHLGCEPLDPTLPKKKDKKQKEDGRLEESTPPRFPAACAVLVPLRVQDLATSRAALEGALLRDVITMLGGQALSDETVQHSVRVLDAVVMELLANPHRSPDSGTAKVLEQELLSLALKSMDDAAKKFCDVKSKAEQVVILSSFAMGRCERWVGEEAKAKGLAACPILTFVEDFARSSTCFAQLEPRQLTYARAIANHLLVAIASPPGQATDADKTRDRLRHGLDAFFDSACLLSDYEKGCAGTQKQTRVIALMRNAIGASLDQDTNSLVAAAGQVIMISLDEDKRPGAVRALRLVGGLLQYAGTYRSKTSLAAGNVLGTADKEEDAEHARRTKILESLTEEMTDRTGREEDNIWSLGGALRTQAGVRLRSGERAFYGPLSLPLGVGFQSSNTGGVGLHLEFNAVDLGQYLAFESTGVVRKPDPADVLSPSIGIGAFWGKDFPVVLAASVGYSPQYQFEGDAEKRGSFNAALTLGIYVPLLDIN